MELIQTQTRTIHQISAEWGGWNINASVTIQDGKIQNVDGYANKEGVENVTFGAWRNGDKLTRNVHNVTDDSYRAYEVIEDFLSALTEKYAA